MAKYFIMSQRLTENGCSLTDYPKDLKKSFAPSNGIKMGDDYPDGFEFRMSNEMGGKKVDDLIMNTYGYCMASEKLTSLFRKDAKAEIEYLPFALLDHKKNSVDQQCCIINVLGMLDCVDMSRTKGDEDPVNVGRLMYIEELHLNHEAIGDDVNLFRIAARPRVMIVRDDLKEVMEKASISGVDFFGEGEAVSLG